MTREELFRKNQQLSTEFELYLLDHPEIERELRGQVYTFYKLQRRGKWSSLLKGNLLIDSDIRTLKSYSNDIEINRMFLLF